MMVTSGVNGVTDSNWKTKYLLLRCMDDRVSINLVRIKIYIDYRYNKTQPKEFLLYFRTRSARIVFKFKLESHFEEVVRDLIIAIDT